MICGSGGAEPAGQMRDEKLHAVVARSTFGSENAQNTTGSDHFWKVVARSTFPSQNVQNTSASDHFWKLRCRKSARRCGAKHISKSKCTKHLSVGPLLEVEMSKKCTPLWREAHFEVKMYKTPHVRATFGCSDVDLRGSHLVKSEQKREGFAAFTETMAGVGRLKRSSKDAFSVAGAVQKTFFVRDR